MWTKVTEARAALGISKAELLPWLDSNNGWERKQTSDNSPNQSGIANVYKLGIDASWEIDIFGGNRYKVDATTADLQTQHAQLHAAWVTLTSEVAINYLSLRTLQERLSIAEANLSLQENTVQLLQSKYNNGLIDGLGLNQAKYTASQTKSTIPTIKISIEETLNNLAVLTGQLSGSLEKILIEKKLFQILMK
ncbi:TolC family protein [Fusobacterium sp.]|uniref:TolC family protein n=1 Tax=Fusobacterium sp. TaxID=68766 RepID=UPI002900DFB2|nr:TolC family protein [Fusobacterium sp.]MDU1910172.1 TolC family protein [Fusobacterium sp.]